MPGFKQLALFVSALLPFASASPVDMVRPRQESEVIPNKYIITLKEDVTADAVESHLSWVGEVHSRSLSRRQLPGVEKNYSISSFQGYAGSFDEATIAEIEASPEVAAVEQDQIWYLSAIVTQSSVPSWGLAAVSKRAGAGTTSYVYDNSAGSGTYAYVLDTGVSTTHQDFGGRASLGYNVVGGSNADADGHGTHVSGTIAGSTYGVAKQANIIGVKVFAGDSGTTSDVLDGFDWAVNHIISNGRQSRSAISMSLGGGVSTAFNNAVNSAYSSGVLSIVAAGNEAVDASTKSPASAANAFTVGATTNGDGFATYSNYGSVVDILAPGSAIVSTYIGSNSATYTASGTSMATPHVTGLALYLMALEGLSTPAAVTSRLKALGTSGLISGVPSRTANLFAYNGNGA